MIKVKVVPGGADFTGWTGLGPQAKVAADLSELVPITKSPTENRSATTKPTGSHPLLTA